jgi:superfamily II DNA or RNA helicase
MDFNNHYKIQIYERYRDLINSGLNIANLDNNHLWKIFEYFSCIKLTEEHKTQFYEYNDIDPTFKEDNRMSRKDTGIDACNLIDSIVQCKLRKGSLTLQECSTFFASQNTYSEELDEIIVRWKKIYITRNQDSILSEHLLEKKNFKSFHDITFPREDIIGYCEDLIKNPPEYPIFKEEEFKLRDYQHEAIEIIKNSENSAICIPTGCGKNSIIIFSMIRDNINNKDNKKYLILVPRIILMEQLKDEIIKVGKINKKDIQLIGDNNTVFDKNTSITISVFNSVGLIMDYMEQFEKIYIDEAHHIEKPEIYKLDDESDLEEEIDNINDLDDSENESDFDEISEESLKDDSEDELNSSTYIQLISSLTKYKNNVYLSATIDEINGFSYYKKDIRDMIEQKYLTDYSIHVPIFNDDPSNKNICEYVIKNYKNMIIYCNSQKEGKEINKMMNSILNKSCDYLDCNTGRIKRNDIINRFKSGKLSFIVNVRILIEGFNAEITKGVIFMHLPKSSTTLIQIIGRALRLHHDKSMANIILPYSCDEDKDNISNFLRVISNNDKRIKKTYETKKLGGYISFELNEEENYEHIEDETSIIDFRFEMIYNSIGVLKNGEELWMKRLDEVKKYIDENKKRPTESNKNKDIKKLGKWLSHSQQNYKNIGYMMKNENIKKKWSEFLEEYKLYFLNNEEVWYKNLKLVENYIYENKQRPSSHDKNKNIKKIGVWIIRNQIIYTNKKDIMKNQYIYNKWSEFLEEYNEYFESNNEIWYKNLKLVENYINKNNKKPSDHSKNKDIQKIGRWISNNQSSYKNKEKIMKNIEIYNKWTSFLAKYKKIFLNNEEILYESLKLLFKFVEKNNRCPKNKETYEDFNIGTWFQQYKQKIKDNNCDIYKELSVNPIIKDNLDEYLENKKINKDKLKLTFDESLSLLFEFVEKNNRFPKNKESYKDLNIGYWYQDRKTDINNTESDTYKQLSVNPIIKDNLDEYLKNKEINKDKLKLTFDESLNLILEFVKNKNKCPIAKESYKNVNIGTWYNHRKTDINNTESDIYKQLSVNPIIKDNLDEYLKNKAMNKDKIKLTFDESLSLIFEFVKNKNRCPIAKESYKNVNIGTWYNHRKTDINNTESDTYKQLSVNPIIKDNLDKYLAKKMNKIC